MLHFGLASTDEIAEELATRLLAHRLAQDLPQSELAASAGISRKTLTTFEKSGKVSLEVFLRIVAALGLSESLSTWFELKIQSIRAMERLSRWLHRSGSAQACMKNCTTRSTPR